MSGRARVLAPAKINLRLRVLGRRPDQYHEIDTLFQAVDLCDEIEVELVEGELRLDVEGPDLGPSEDNLAYRAAAILLSHAGVESGAHVRLLKRVPVGAGLGGGSSDAAAVLRCLSSLLGIEDGPELRELGTELGSDVPFFLGESPLARGRGRGELLEPITPLPRAHLVLVSPQVHVSTAGAYAALAEVRAGSSVATDEDVRTPSLVTWAEVETLAENDFEPVIGAAHPEIRRALGSLRSAGASVALMTGSGSTCFGLFPSGAEADAAAEELQGRLRWPCHAVRTLTDFPEVVVG